MYEVVTAIQLSPISDVSICPSICRQWTCLVPNPTLCLACVIPHYLFGCFSLPCPFFHNFFPTAVNYFIMQTCQKKKRKAVQTKKYGWNTIIVETFKQRKNSQDTLGQMVPMYFSVYNSGTRLVWWNS